MPVPMQPLTPSSSVDIASQDRPSNVSSDIPLKLPPPAIQSPRAAKHPRPGSSAKQTASPVEEESTRKRKRASAQATSPSEPQTPSFSLPPPPTRSRTIIQMQPGTARAEKGQGSRKSAEKSKTEGTKRANASSGAGKRATRKTAHSVIEKRRRSKMNEEFDIMKEMIPACKGQSMHKLAILQAGIEYLQYLEQCVTELKSNSQISPRLPPGSTSLQAPNLTYSPILGEEMSEDEDEDNDSENDEDDDNEPEQSDEEPDTPRTYPSYYPETSQSHDGMEVSPAMSQHRSPTLGSGESSPAITGRSCERAERPYQTSEHSHGSCEADMEATTALLMLNGDRGSKGGRGLRVQDLLIG